MFTIAQDKSGARIICETLNGARAVCTASTSSGAGDAAEARVRVQRRQTHAVSVLTTRRVEFVRQWSTSDCVPIGLGLRERRHLGQ